MDFCCTIEINNGTFRFKQFHNEISAAYYAYFFRERVFPSICVQNKGKEQKNQNHDCINRYLRDCYPVVCVYSFYFEEYI